MRKFIVPAVIIAAMGAAAPAAAQYHPGYGNQYRSDNGVDRRIERIEDRIRKAADRGRISPREANRLIREARGIDRLEDRYSRNGLTRREHQDIQNRIHHLQQRLRFDRQDGRRWNDRDRDDRWDRD